MILDSKGSSSCYGCAIRSPKSISRLISDSQRIKKHSFGVKKLVAFDAFISPDGVSGLSSGICFLLVVRAHSSKSADWADPASTSSETRDVANSETIQSSFVFLDDIAGRPNPSNTDCSPTKEDKSDSERSGIWTHIPKIGALIGRCLLFPVARTRRFQDPMLFFRIKKRSPGERA